MPQATTLDHIALVVADPARTAALLQEIFEAKAIHRHDADDHDETCVQIGGIWFVLVAGTAERPLTGDHVAFHVSAGEMRAIVGRLQRAAHACWMARSDTAVYFTDYDNHVFEVNSTGIEAELAGKE